MQTVENKAKEFFEKSKKDFGKMQKQVPDTISGLSGMFEKIMEDGALSIQQLESLESQTYTFGKGSLSAK